MRKSLVDGGATGVEEIISELHERGVKSGQQESERILAGARVRATEILAEAGTECDRIVADGQREAERLQQAAREEATQMLEAFMASVPDIFARRASALLDDILPRTFDPHEQSETVSAFVACLDDDKEKKLKHYLAVAKPQGFIEGLLVMAVAFYADAEGFDSFVIDSGLKSAWTRLCGDPTVNLNIPFEFRDGISGFTVAASNGREIVVSPECVRLMAQAWAGEEFRDVYSRVTAAEHKAGD